MLLRSAGQPVSREHICNEALGRTLLAYDRSVDVHVSNLRRKLGKHPDGSPRIHTIRGTGYLYARQATEHELQSAPETENLETEPPPYTQNTSYLMA